jgi:acyl carrier protein
MQESDRLDKHFDSLDRIELAIDLERELNCNISDGVIDSWQTIKDVIDTMSKYMENKN